MTYGQWRRFSLIVLYNSVALVDQAIVGSRVNPESLSFCDMKRSTPFNWKSISTSLLAPSIHATDHNALANYLTTLPSNKATSSNFSATASGNKNILPKNHPTRRKSFPQPPPANPPLTHSYRITMRFLNGAALCVIITIMFIHVQAGPIAYGICQGGCSTLAVACYAAAGAVFGTVLAVTATPAVVSCNAAFGSCSASCAAAFLIPGP